MANSRLFTSFLWRFLERCGTHGITLLVSLILARLLGPEVFGTLALVTVFTAVLQTFVNSGLGSALIQKKDADSCDFSSVFFCNLVLSLFLYAALFSAAPRIAAFYGRQDLTKIIRVLGLTVVFYGITNIQQAYISRHLLFRTFFLVTLVASLVAAAVGIGLAYCGYGIWALVAQQLTHCGAVAAGLFLSLNWRPTLEFSWARLKGLLSYGWKLLVSALVDRSYTELRALIIGRMYAPTDLAFYNRGFQMPNLLSGNINDAIDSVVFPTMSQAQNDRERVKAMMRKAIQLSTCVVAPLMVCLAVVGSSLVRLILSEQWLPCVPYLRIFCITFMFMPIHTANLNAIKALGRSDLFLRLEILKKIVGIGLILASMWFGVMAMAYTMLVQSFLSQIINTWPNYKLLDYSYLEQLRDVLPYLFLATVMGLIALLPCFFQMPDVGMLTLQTLLGAIVYCSGLILLRLEGYVYFRELFRTFAQRHFGVKS